MRQSAYDPVPRWCDRPTGGRSDEDRASALTRDCLLSGALADGLSDLQLARIEQNLRAMDTLVETGARDLDAGRHGARPPAQARWRVRLALAALVVVVTATGSMIAYQTGKRPHTLAEPEAPPAPAAEAVTPRVAGIPAPPAPQVAPLTPNATDPLPVAGAQAARGADPVLAPSPASPATAVGSGATPATATGEAPARPSTAGPEPAADRHEAVAVGPIPVAALPLGTAPSRSVTQAKTPAQASAAGPSVAARSTKLAAGLPRSTNDAPPSAAYSEPTSGSPELIRASQEILALDHALSLLRSKHDAQAALQALDDYLARFPAGVLGHEARMARVDALLMLKRSDEALLALEALPLDEHRRAAELQVVRGELRSRGDCLLAERDFSAVLARVRSATLEERALWGRASCRNKRGDVTGATQDLRRYVERFPNGPHAAWARRWLENAD